MRKPLHQDVANDHAEEALAARTCRPPHQELCDQPLRIETINHSRLIETGEPIAAHNRQNLHEAASLLMCVHLGRNTKYAWGSDDECKHHAVLANAKACLQEPVMPIELVGTASAADPARPNHFYQLPPFIGRPCLCHLANP
jgi:hypothetical protein